MNHKDPAWLDSMYNNRSLVPDYASYFERWIETSKAVRTSQPCMLDVPYGKGPGEKLDIFPTNAQYAPVVVFIHGGYWRYLTSLTILLWPPPSQRKARVLWW